MAKRIEEKFFKCVYDIIEYWAKQEKDNLTGEKFTDKDKIICCITENEEFEYDEVFETKAEAEAKLRELKGEGDAKD